MCVWCLVWLWYSHFGIFRPTVLRPEVCLLLGWTVATSAAVLRVFLKYTDAHVYFQHALTAESEKDRVVTEGARAGSGEQDPSWVSRVPSE